MGYQLWTSPLTGYRRRGTRLTELRALIESGITARAILEPLQSCPIDAPSSEIARLLKARDFDVAGVKETRSGPVVGFVFRESLKRGAVREQVKPMRAENLISDSTSLPMVLAALKERQHVFVLGGLEVDGIVTRTDLNKPPVRIYLFGLMTLLEMHLGFWVRAKYPDDRWLSELEPGRVEAAKKLQDSRRQRNQQVSLLDCLQFCDKRDLVVRRKDLCTDLKLTANTLSRLRRAEDVRNLLAHGQQDLVDGSTWESLFDLIDWIETLVHRSDERVERWAREIAGGPLEPLWLSS